MCKKTKMCRFFAKASCNRGQNCHFAHDLGELAPMPNLSRTKLCGILRATGSCTDPTCTFAHDKRELRILAKQELRTLGKHNGSSLDVTVPTQAPPLNEDEEGLVFAPNPLYHQEAARTELSVCVKNTFITVDSATECHQGRSKSAPPRLVQLGDANRLVLRCPVESPWGVVRSASPVPRARKQSSMPLNLTLPFA